MSESLVDLVNAHFLPMLKGRHASIESHEEYESFGGGNVVIASPSLRMRVENDRGTVILTDVGPPSQPAAWFDAPLVADYLGLPGQVGPPPANHVAALESFGTFLTMWWSELAQAFDSDHWLKTRADLEQRRRERADRMFGPLPPAGE
jgi:hypothetical protein